MREPFVLLDDACVNGHSRLYRRLQHTDYIAADEDVTNLDSLLQAGWHRQWQAVLLAPYEFGCPPYGIAARMDKEWPLHDGTLRLLWFADCAHLDAEGVSHWLAEQDLSTTPAGLTALAADTGESEYCAAVEQIQRLIAAGDTYQVNYTMRLHGQMFGDPLRLYRNLRQAQPVPYGALICLNSDEWVLSLSPELFIRHNGHGLLTAQPMKGTAPRSGETSRDQQAAHALAADAKNRAENVMIVDLLRNDLGRIAQTGSVAVPALFSVEPFGRVLQMTSTVTAQAQQPLSYADLWRALFPCGSITGAPKRRTMQIIKQTEKSPRGLYTGAIGWIDPPKKAGQPGAFCLSVAIRTLLLSALQPDGWRRGELGIGSGIVTDSDPRNEYEECGWKSRFLREHDPGFGLIETMRVEQGRCELLDTHLHRLSTAAARLGFSTDLPSIHTDITQHSALLDISQIWRLKLTLYKSGEYTLQHAPLSDLPPGPVLVRIDKQTLPVTDPLRAFKTTARQPFDTAWQTAERHGAFDGLLFNSLDELLEGGRSSVFIKLNGEWLTPPRQSGVLPGVQREQVLNGQMPLNAPVREAIITREMLMQAQEIALSNALRGVLAARLMY